MKNRSLLIAGLMVITILIVAVVSVNAYQNKDETQDGFKVSLNGKAWFFIEDKLKLEELLEEYKNQCVAEIAKDAKIKSVDFKQKLAIVEVNDFRGEFCIPQEASKTIRSNAEMAQVIQVKDGDNIWSIAKDNQLSVEEIGSLNPQLDEEMRIYPGDELTITAERPILDVMVVYECTVVEDVPFTTEYISDSGLYESQREVISSGIVGKEERIYEILLENGIEIQRKTLDTKTITAPVASKVRIGTKKAVSRSGSSFGIVSGRLTSSFGTRTHPVTGKKTFHKGIDIGASHGSSVYSYASGTVSFADWKSGYGNFVAINHGNGLVSRYGHLSAISVKVGQKVNVRQKIGAVGSTGVSTGPHLHFEVLLNGDFKNPQNYL